MPEDRKQTQGFGEEPAWIERVLALYRRVKDSRGENGREEGI